MKSRIYFLDNLRTFLVFLVVLHHASLVYQPGFEGSWIVSDSTKSSVIGFISLYGDVFVMFLIFFISGYCLPPSLKRSSTRDFLKAKFQRTMVPWLVAVVTLIPLYKVIFLYARNMPAEVWYSYFHFFERAGADPKFWPNSPHQQWLWFLPVLFLFQTVYLLMHKLNLLTLNLGLKTAIVLVFGIGFLQSLLFTSLGLRGWSHSLLLDFQNERLLVYFMVFLLGSLCNKLNVFEDYQRPKKWFASICGSIAAGLVLFTGLAFNFFLNILYPGREYFILSPSIDVTVYYASFLLLMLGSSYLLLDLFVLRFNKPIPSFNYLNKNTHLVYVIHMVVIGAFALPLLYVPAPFYIKLPILVLAAFVGSNLLVHAARGATRMQLRLNWLKPHLIKRTVSDAFK